MIKSLRQMVYGCLCCLLAACSASEEIRPAEGTERVNVTFRLARLEEVIPQNEMEEWNIYTIRVYAFRRNQNKVEGYYYKDISEQTRHEFSMEVPSDYINFYFIVNEKEAGDLKTDNTTAFTAFPEPELLSDGTWNFKKMTLTEDDLKKLTFTKLPEATLQTGDPDAIDETGKTYQSPRLPMTAVVAPSYRMSGNLPPIEVELLRSVGKLTFRFSQTGQGALFMGRGMYLYNVPQYGYLFPKAHADLETLPASGYIGRKEALPNDPVPEEDKPFYEDSRLHQLNGVKLLSNGWKGEPDNYDPAKHGHPDSLDINRITKYINDPDEPDEDSYQEIPDKSFYVFANPHEISPNGTQTDFICKPDKAANGYYVKILAHEHLNQEGSKEIHYKREMFYVHLPKVEANEHVTVNSIFSLDGHTSIFPNWIVKEWAEAGGDITFN